MSKSILLLIVLFTACSPKVKHYYVFSKHVIRPKERKEIPVTDRSALNFELKKPSGKLVPVNFELPVPGYWLTDGGGTLTGWTLAPAPTFKVICTTSVWEISKYAPSGFVSHPVTKGKIYTVVQNYEGVDGLVYVLKEMGYDYTYTASGFEIINLLDISSISIDRLHMSWGMKPWYATSTITKTPLVLQKGPMEMLTFGGFKMGWIKATKTLNNK